MNKDRQRLMVLRGIMRQAEVILEDFNDGKSNWEDTKADIMDFASDLENYWMERANRWN